MISAKEAASVKRVQFLDCRFSLAVHAEGQHAWTQARLPGARHLHMEHDLAGNCDGSNGRHPLPTCEQFQESLRKAGVNAGDTLVVYDEQRFAGAARAWWLLRYFGVSDVRVLDGGLKGWRDAGFAFETGTPSPIEPGNIKLDTGPRTHLVATAREVANLSAQDDTVLIDAREPQRFRGEAEPIDPVAGRIPGAVNYPWAEVTDDHGYLRETDWHQSHWQALSADSPAIVYCGSGVTASVNLLSMAIAGRKTDRLYAGSFSEWCADQSRPIERDT